jgi:hypothetical protein
MEDIEADSFFGGLLSSSWIAEFPREAVGEEVAFETRDGASFTVSSLNDVLEAKSLEVAKDGRPRLGPGG